MPGAASRIVSMSRAIVILWVLALIASAPLFRSLDSVVSSGEEGFLPRGSESSIAGSMVSSISGGGGGDVLYVRGINVSLPENSLRASRAVLGSADGVGVEGYPALVDQIYRASENASLQALRVSSAAAADLLELARSLDSNLTSYSKPFENLSKSLAMLKDLIRRADQGYSQALDALERLSRNFSGALQAVALLDKAYSETYRQAVAYSAQASQIMGGLVENKSAREDLSRLFLYLWWQAARAVYYYNYSPREYAEITNLSSIDPRLAPLPLEEAAQLYTIFSNLTSHGKSPDEAVTAIVVEQLLPRQLQTPPGLSKEAAAIIAQIVDRSWAAVPKSGCLYCALQPPQGSSSSQALQSQLILLQSLLNMSPSLSEAVASQGPRILLGIFEREAISRGADEQLASELASMIVWNNVSRDRILEILADRASQAVGMNISSQLQHAVKQLDPEASGTIASNTSLAREALAIVLSQALGIGLGASSKIVDALEKGLPRGGLAEILRPEISKAVENATGGLARAGALDNVLAKYDPSGLGLLTRDEQASKASVDLLLEISRGTDYGSILAQIPRSYLEALAAGEEWVGVLKNLTLSRARDEIEARALRGSVPGEIVEDLKAFVAWAVVSWPNSSQEDLEARVEAIIRSQVSRISSSSAASEGWGLQGILAGGALADLIAKDSVSIAMGRASLEGAAGEVALEIFSKALEAVLGQVRGRLVGENLASFIALYTVRGNASAEASRAFAERAKKALEAYFPNAQVFWTGSTALSQDLSSAASEDVSRISRVSEILVFAVLLAVLGSLAAVILPYAGIVLGVVVGGGVAYLAALSGAADMLSLTRILIYVIPLGLGSDYAAYLVHRFREEYGRFRDPARAAEEALRRAGPAIVASALTVMAGFGSLALGWEFPLFRSIGVYIPVVVGVTAAACLTLVPSILSIAGGSRLFWWGLPRRGGKGFGRVSSRLLRMGPVAPAIFVLASIASLAVYPTIEASHDLRLLLPSNSQALQALDAMASDIGYGRAFPVYVVVDLKRPPGPGDLAALEELASRISKIHGVSSVEAPTRPFGEPLSNLSQALENPASRSFLGGAAAYLRIVLGPDPFSREAVDLVREIRSQARSWASEHGYTVYVGGSTASSEELDELVNRIFWARVLPFSIAVMIAIFALAFGGLLAALVAVMLVTASSMVSIVVTGLVFSKMLSTPMIWFLPQVVFTAMLGVGMDYNSFYMARAREECLRRGRCGREGALRAVEAVGRLVVGLAFVVAAAFGSLMLSSTPGFREIGLSLLISALLVSTAASYLVAPPLIAVAGRRAWAPLSRGLEREAGTDGV